jgi:FtsP/CotA-like multicopper oxidase with cupredoxin domain
MPGMETCDEYFGIKPSKKEQNSDEYFNLGASAEYPNKSATEIVELQDGDSYEISMQNIKQTIGGKDIRMMSYNGSVPGPLIKIPQNATINLTVTNDIADITSTVHHH